MPSVRNKKKEAIQLYSSIASSNKKENGGWEVGGVSTIRNFPPGFGFIPIVLVLT